MVQLHDILSSNLSKHDVVIEGKVRVAVESAMVDFAKVMVDRYRSGESKSVNLEAIKLFPALWYGQWRLWLRKRSFLKAKKAAQIQADIENRPFYVIRSTEISYVVQSTLVVRNLKRRRIYGRHATAIKMRETADFVAMPKGR